MEFFDKQLALTLVVSEYGPALGRHGAAVGRARGRFVAVETNAHFVCCHLVLAVTAALP